MEILLNNGPKGLRSHETVMTADFEKTARSRPKNRQAPGYSNDANGSFSDTGVCNDPGAEGSVP